MKVTLCRGLTKLFAIVALTTCTHSVADTSLGDENLSDLEDDLINERRHINKNLRSKDPASKVLRRLILNEQTSLPPTRPTPRPTISRPTAFPTTLPPVLLKAEHYYELEVSVHVIFKNVDRWHYF
jgi:hypothetical protein